MRERRDIEGLINVLNFQRNPAVRRAAAAALGEIRDSRAVEPLISTLTEDKTLEVRRSAAAALGRLGDARAVEPLIAALEFDQLRIAASQALGILGDVRAVEPLLALLKDESALGLKLSVPCEALGKLGDARAVEPLIEALSHPQSDRRKHAAEALGALGDARAVEPLIAALKDEESFVFTSAIVALGKIGDARAVAPLISMLADDHLVEWRQMLCRQELHQIAATHPDEKIVRLIHAAEREYKDKQARKRAAAGRPPIGEAGAERRYIGGLGEPYCSESCYARGAQYAMVEIPGAHCGVCGKPVLSRSGQRDCAVIPYEGKTLVVCPSCAPGVQTMLSRYTKCCVCQKPL